MLLWRRGAVLLVRHPFHPCDRVAVERFLDRDMAHGRRRRGAVPVLLAGFERDHVTRADFFDCAALALNPAETGSDDEDLPERMCVPRSARTRLECNQGHRYARRLGWTIKRVYSYSSGEVFSWPFA